MTISYDAWKANLLAEIDAEPNTTSRGDRFVQQILRYYFQLSEDDAINSTDAAGAGDHGIDAFYLVPPEENQPLEAIVLQGKYGGVGQTFSPYQEFSKFSHGLQAAIKGSAPTDALQQCASILQSKGLIQYIYATIDPLPNSLLSGLEDVRNMASGQFRDQVLIEAISLSDIYQRIAMENTHEQKVALTCQGVEPIENVFVGVSSLIDIYLMLDEYANKHQGVLDSIYDRNVRKWLGRRTNRVNAGIAKTLSEEPSNFVGFNNGITLVCRSFFRTDEGLHIEAPQVVNGCQTTRTLYDFMENHLPGLGKLSTQHPKAQPYLQAFLPFKLIAVANLDDEVVQEITRFSNRQNAVRGRDFLSLEKSFRDLQKELRQRGYFLEVQTGEYSVLTKAQKEQFPVGRMLNAFDALRFYGAAVIGRPHTAFGRSGDFTPGGREFEDITEGLSADDLLVPWLMAQEAGELGYSIGAKWKAAIEDHRNQTRYFFLYIFFRVASQVLRDTPTIDRSTRSHLYDQLLRLREHYLKTKSASAPLRQMLDLADGFVAAYMAAAKVLNWYVDRNAFLKSDNILNEERLLPYNTQLLLKKDLLKKEALSVL